MEITYVQTTQDKLSQIPISLGQWIYTRDTSSLMYDMASTRYRICPVYPNAGSHNSIYRGAYLGTSVTSAQWTAIQNGTFDDLYIGDYWTINSQNWRIAHFDYWLNTGDGQCTAHHVVIVPDGNLLNGDGSTTHYMDDQNTTAGGYAGTGFFSGTNHSGSSNTARSQCITIVNSAFGSSHILSHRGLFTNASTDGWASNWAWYDSTVDLMNESMVYGTRAWSNQASSTTGASGNGYDVGIDKTQLALFAMNPAAITNRANWWLRDVYSAPGFCFVGDSGAAHIAGASVPWVGVRPAFAIK